MIGPAGFQQAPQRVNQDIISFCIGCGCSDDNACANGGCYWLVVNRKQGFGVCSRCPGHMRRWRDGVRERGSQMIRKGVTAAPSFSAALRDTRNAPSTNHQHLYIRTLMRDADLDTFIVTLMHRRHFEAASLPVPSPGSRVEEVLCALTKGQASALINALQKEVAYDD